MLNPKHIRLSLFFHTFRILWLDFKGSKRFYPQIISHDSATAFSVIWRKYECEGRMFLVKIRRDASSQIQIIQRIMKNQKPFLLVISIYNFLKLTIRSNLR